jgi:hypothetical protein
MIEETPQQESRILGELGRLQKEIADTYDRGKVLEDRLQPICKVEEPEPVKEPHRDTEMLDSQVGNMIRDAYLDTGKLKARIQSILERLEV